MSKYRRFAICFILIQILLLVAVNLFVVKTIGEKQGKPYNVDASRIATRMEHGEDYRDINLAEYETIVCVSPFDEHASYLHPYIVKRVNDQLYCFEYVEYYHDNRVKALNILAVSMIVLNLVLLIYLDKNMMTPFSKMDHLTVELAKGNLSTPIKQEKSKFFARFLWGMDMLRETLEGNRKRELELLKEKKTLILSLSHDIKTPLSAIDLYTKALRRNLYDSEKEREKAFDGIEQNVAEIKRYVNEITQASREDVLNLEVKNAEIYLSQLIDKTKVYYADKMRRLHIDFSVEQVDDCLIHGDLDRLIEVLQNTIENAIKYGDGKQIRITFDEEENCKLIRVMNTGCDLSEDELPHIFDSFYRGKNSEKEEGSGLGLYICKELMHRMDGEIFAAIGEDTYTITLVIRKL